MHSPLIMKDIIDDQESQNNSENNKPFKVQFYEFTRGYRQFMTFMLLLMTLITFGQYFHYHGSNKYYENYQTKNYSVIQHYNVEFINTNYPTQKPNTAPILLISYSLPECGDHNTYSKFIMRDSLYSPKNTYFDGQELVLSYDCANKNIIFADVKEVVEFKGELYNMFHYTNVLLAFHVLVVVIFEALMFHCVLVPYMNQEMYKEFCKIYDSSDFMTPKKND
jgi:hypothetical protein